MYRITKGIPYNKEEFEKNLFNPEIDMFWTLSDLGRKLKVLNKTDNTKTNYTKFGNYKPLC